MEDGRATSHRRRVRAALPVLLLVVAAALLVPAPATRGPITWGDLIAPLRVGGPLVRGFVLSPPRRGEAHDVVYVARRQAGVDSPAARVEIHIVDRGVWEGVAQTRSFGIAWEVPPNESVTGASPEDSQAVTDLIYRAIQRHNPDDPEDRQDRQDRQDRDDQDDQDDQAHHHAGNGGRGGALGPVDAIPLTADPTSPTIARVVDRLAGWRGAAIGTLVTLAVLLTAAAPRGTPVIAIALFLLGIGLRAPQLDLPFNHDQDVQRMFTGNAPLAEIATGVGLRDRHPPLYFFVLHAAQRLGQSEAHGRAPAVLAGAMVGPALLLAAAAMRRRGRVSRMLAALAALAATASPVLIARSREVSEIPLFSLTLIAAAASLVAAIDDARPRRLASVAISHALALFTYYLAPFVIAAHAAVLAAVRTGLGAARLAHLAPVARALAVGVVLGSPALVLGGITLLSDGSARDTARAFPTLAWGDHAPLQISAHMTRIAVEAFGTPLAVVIAAAILFGVARRNLAVIVPAAGAAATFAGIALLSPIARVQAYYITTVLPLALLAFANWQPRGQSSRSAWLAGAAVATALFTVPLLAGARNLYVPDADAFMPRFADRIAERPETTVITVAHYDKTLLAYYLARAEGHSIAWHNWNEAHSKNIEALVKVHSLQPGQEDALLGRLDQWLSDGPALVIDRDAVQLPALARRLSDCERLDEAPSARLLRCRQR